jgi:DNA-binding HxlR family transcriptional regulator/putative sterol carrier protein
MATKRTYGDACGVARALDRVGERWALMVVRELLLGAKRFTDLRAGLPHVSADVLAQRLRELEELGVVRRRKLPPPAALQVYELTDWGRELEPVVMALGAWGARAPLAAPEVGMSVDSHALMLRTLFDPERAEDFEARLELRLAGQPFRVEVHDGRIEVVHGELPDADAVASMEPQTLVALMLGERSYDEVLAAGDVEVEGDAARVARLLTLFRLPESAATGC